VLIIHTDTRLIDVDLPTGPATMARPTVAQWRQIRERYIEAEQKVKADPEHASDVQYGPDAPYATAFSFTVGLLAGVTPPDPEHLPVDATSINPFLAMANLWLTPQIDEQGPPDDFTPIPGA
jgi:hypothetical protein